MTNEVALNLISLVRKANLVNTIREIYGEISKLNDKKDKVWISIKSKNLKETNEFEESIKDLSDEEKNIKSSEFYDSLVDSDSRNMLEKINTDIQDCYWMGVNKALLILDTNKDDLYKFISIYKNIDIEEVKNSDLELTIEVIQEVLNDKSFLSLIQLFKK